MNRYFVSIKVDREERPDLDSIYMSATQAMTQHGGWPMTVFPHTGRHAVLRGNRILRRTDRGGMPGFAKVVQSLGEAYQNERENVLENASRIRTYLQEQSAPHGERGEISGRGSRAGGDFAEASLRLDERRIQGRAKVSPANESRDALLRSWRRTGDDDALHMVEHTLHKMIRGGIHDQLGGGFHRYSVDSKWLVPHFEKMLYDNAQLTRLLLETYQATGKSIYQRARHRHPGLRAS